jgi:excisionase family DNA binding protein
MRELTPPKLAYSIREACEASSLGRTTIYSLIGTGKLRAVRVGGRTVIPGDSLMALVSGTDSPNSAEGV